MNVNDNMNFPLRGEIELFHRFHDGREDVLLEKKNVVLNEGADILAQALAGNCIVNGMYFAYTNVAPIAEPTPPKTRKASYYQTTGSTADKGFTRAPVIAAPSFSSTDVIYNTNQVTFVSISTGTVEIDVGGTNGVIDGTSQFYGAALSCLHPSDITKDLLFSSVTFGDINPTSHFTKIAGADLGLRWNIFIEIP